MSIPTQSSTPQQGHRRGLDLVPVATEKGTKKEYSSDQEVRWCPGCGDYAILSAVQSFLPELGLKRENIVCISGIGCAARFPYYLNTYGMHSIHGRAPAIATGLATSRPDLSVWVIGGDGDFMSIGGNHLIHALRRNVNVTLLMFNNRIYGLTKGQYSPTSEVGKLTKSTPMGSIDRPFNPVSLALGAEATFVARTIDSDRKHLTAVLRAATEHRGSAFVEILQNCNIFNDGAYDVLKDPDTRDTAVIRLEQGEPLRFGTEGQKGVRLSPNGGLEIVDVNADNESSLLVHDAGHDQPSIPFMLSRLGSINDGVTPIGIFRSVERDVYDDEVRGQIDEAVAKTGRGDLTSLLTGGDTWTVN
jgi:2-oxoglutarate/2-oxoacid ferredoxin oxidoreductase subunit beta